MANMPATRKLTLRPIFFHFLFLGFISVFIFYSLLYNIFYNSIFYKKIKYLIF